MDAELVLDSKARLGEGSVWDNRTHLLYWVDILAGEVHRFEPKSGNDTATGMGQDVGTVVPRGLDDCVVALRDGIYSADLVSGTVVRRAAVEADKPGNRFNDGKCDPAGRFWAGTLNDDDHRGGHGALYRIDPGWKPEKILENISVSNGICWNAERNAMYYTDTPTGELWRFDYDDATGEVGNQTVAVEVDTADGRPDGMTIDAEGMLWVAMWSGAKVCRYNPESGSKLSEIGVAATQVTSCAFGGDDLGDLFITTARNGLAGKDLDKQPHAGGVFRARPGTVGVEASYCKL